MNTEQLLDSMVDARWNTTEEIAEAGAIILDFKHLTHAERNDMVGLYKSGPLPVGDLPIARFFQDMMEKGYVTYFVVQGQEGRYACSTKGGRLCELIIQFGGEFPTMS